MKIKTLKSFSYKLVDQVEFIAQDKPFAARKFKIDVLNILKELEVLPYKQRKFIYFDDEKHQEFNF